MEFVGGGKLAALPSSQAADSLSIVPRGTFAKRGQCF
jgi:hypothetical protein